MNDRISVDIQDGVADVRLIRADKMNALDNAMFDAEDRTRFACRGAVRGGPVVLCRAGYQQFRRYGVWRAIRGAGVRRPIGDIEPYVWRLKSSTARCDGLA